MLTASLAPDMQQIMPMLLLCGVACVILLGDLFWSRFRALNPALAILGVLAATGLVIKSLPWQDANVAFAGAVKADSMFGASSLILLVTALLSILMAWTYLQNRGLDHGEYYVLILFAVAGAMLMAAANDLIVLFLGLEVLSFSLYVLAGFARTDERSEEASIKYFLLGAFASAFFLYGIALIYGATQSTNLTTIAQVVGAGGARNTMMLAGIGLILVGLGFKAAVVPFHQWTPDVYEGAPTSVTAFMAGAAKVGAFAAILRVFYALAPANQAWLSAIQVLAILTMVFGNWLAIQQTNVKRMLAYSSIAHAGYLLVAVAAMAHRDSFELAVSAAMFYLFAYTFMTLGAFAVLVYLSGRSHDFQTLGDLRGLARHDPFAAYSMLFFMLSLGGIPPTMGFMGKWQIFMAAVRGGEITLAIVMALASVMAVYYYLKIVWMMCFEDPREAAPAPPVDRFGAGLAAFLSVAGTLVFGIVPPVLAGLLQVWIQ